MNGIDLRPPSSMCETVTEYACYDSHLLFGTFLRRVLLHVYADAAALVYRPYLQRELALRLLRRLSHISGRYAWRRLADFRGEGPQLPLNASGSDNVSYLAKRVQAVIRPETTALARLMRREDAAFNLRLSAFDPARYAACLEGALVDSLPLTQEELDIVFRCWTPVFAQTLRGAFLRYIEVLANRPDMNVQTHQDFIDTWPAPLGECEPGPRGLDDHDVFVS